MIRLRFSLRQLLLGVVLAAVVLLIARYAMRSHAAGAAVLAICIAAGVLLAINLLLYAALQAVGQFFASGDEDVDASPPDAQNLITAQ